MQTKKNPSHVAIRLVRGAQFLGNTYKAGTLLCLNINDAAIAVSTNRGELIEDYDLPKDANPGVIEAAPKPAK